MCTSVMPQLYSPPLPEIVIFIYNARKHLQGNEPASIHTHVHFCRHGTNAAVTDHILSHSHVVTLHTAHFASTVKQSPKCMFCLNCTHATSVIVFTLTFVTISTVSPQLYTSYMSHALSGTHSHTPMLSHMQLTPTAGHLCNRFAELGIGQALTSQTSTDKTKRSIV